MIALLIIACLALMLIPTLDRERRLRILDERLFDKDFDRNMQTDTRIRNKETVLRILREGKPINDIIGMNVLNIYSVHQRIADLRKEGYVIRTEGKGSNLNYVLVSEPEPIDLEIEL